MTGPMPMRNGGAELNGGQAPDWQFLQCFGERAPDEVIQEADIISAVEFNGDGQHLATGDRCGRVVLFEKVMSQQRPGVPLDQRPGPPANRSPGFEYKYMSEFQSHEPEFDYLKSMEIEEKINKIRWVRSNNSLLLLSTNDKTIKLWKVHEKRSTLLTGFNVDFTNRQNMTNMPYTMGNSISDSQAIMLRRTLRLPQVTAVDTHLVSRCKKTYQNAHSYHINSISVNSDQETFITSDDLRVNMWNLEIMNQSFNIVDIKPSNMEELTEVITSSEFHPKQCHIFAYSSSKGCIRLADMRGSALCDRQAKTFQEVEQPGAAKSFFSEIIASISDVHFSRDGRYMISRDYMTVKYWDLAMERSPVTTLPVHENLRSRLGELYENDCIFDKFDCTINGTGDCVATGSYNNLFRVMSQNGQIDHVLEAARYPMRKRLQSPNKINRSTIRKAMQMVKRSAGETVEMGNDYASKLLHMAWHPDANLIACAASNSLYMFCA